MRAWCLNEEKDIIGGHAGGVTSLAENKRFKVEMYAMDETLRMARGMGLP